MPKVFVVAGPRKSIGKNGPVDIVELDGPGGGPSGALKAEVEAADAGADASKGAVMG